MALSFEKSLLKIQHHGSRKDGIGGITVRRMGPNTAVIKDTERNARFRDSESETHKILVRS